MGTREWTTRRYKTFLLSGVVFIDQSTTTQKGTTLFVGESDAASGALSVHAIRPLEYPNEGQDGESESGPVNEATEICS